VAESATGQFEIISVLFEGGCLECGARFSADNEHAVRDQIAAHGCGSTAFINFEVGDVVCLRSSDQQGVVVSVKRLHNSEQPIDVKVQFPGGSRPWFPPSMIGHVVEEAASL
jgi:hypothetical protein